MNEWKIYWKSPSFWIGVVGVLLISAILAGKINFGLICNHLFILKHILLKKIIKFISFLIHCFCKDKIKKDKGRIRKRVRKFISLNKQVKNKQNEINRLENEKREQEESLSSEINNKQNEINRLENEKRNREEFLQSELVNKQNEIIHLVENKCKCSDCSRFKVIAKLHKHKEEKMNITPTEKNSEKSERSA